MLMMVYSPDGEPFEVTPARARKLVIESGWLLDVPPAKQTKGKAKAVEAAPADTAGG